MGVKITITVSGLTLIAELNDSTVARAIEAKLPFDVRMSRWGDEYYGAIGVRMQSEPGERDVLAVGEMAYWPPGDALCLFFGPTPASTGIEPRAASDVVPLGRIESDTEKLKGLAGSVLARLDRG
ncbi:MAG TPA: cyclophilin-like fold protein [Spirochaetia bacterium]|nr:cyclophilin-like fold protein [Spirochaetia bacterium]